MKKNFLLYLVLLFPLLLAAPQSHADFNRYKRGFQWCVGREILKLANNQIELEPFLKRCHESAAASDLFFENQSLFNDACKNLAADKKIYAFRGGIYSDVAFKYFYDLANGAPEQLPAGFEQTSCFQLLKNIKENFELSESFRSRQYTSIWTELVQEKLAQIKSRGPAF